MLWCIVVLQMAVYRSARRVCFLLLLRYYSDFYIIKTRKSNIGSYIRYAQWVHRYGWPWTNWRTVFLVGAGSTTKQIRAAKDEKIAVDVGDVFDVSDDEDDADDDDEGVDPLIDQRGDEGLSDDEQDLSVDPDETQQQKCVSRP